MPRAEVAIDEGMVRSLLVAQYPALADLPLQPMPQLGWDNALYQLGREFTVRLPRRAAAAGLVQHEARWLPELSRRLPIPVPTPIHAGRPADGYPWHWSINRYVPGAPVDRLADPPVAAKALAGFLTALHKPAPLNAPVNPWRGVPLAARRRRLLQGCAVLERQGRDVGAILASWDRLSRAPRYRGPRVWLHGDLHSGNLLAIDGWLSGVIDFGDLTRGDPAVDFAIAWMLFDEGERAPLREAAAGHGQGTWQRGRAWALAWGVAALAHSDDNPLLAGVAERALAGAVL